MELIIIITFCTLTFFGGICVGAVLSSMPDSLAPHIIGMEESFQPIDSVCFNDFSESAMVLMKYLAENHHPHTTAIVTSNYAELLEGITNTGEINEFLKD